MKKLIALLAGFVVVTAIAYAKGAGLTSALVVGAFYLVPIAITLVLPGWAPIGVVIGVAVLLLFFGPSAPRDRQEGLVQGWGGLWVWITLIAVVVTAWTLFEQWRSRRKAS